MLVLGTDVNGWACEAAGWTVVQALSEQSRDDTGMQKSGDASTLLGMVCADLTSPIRDGMVDVLVFNPPYVPSEDVPEVRDVAASNDTKSSTRSYEHDSQLLSLSYEGGVDGMEVTNRLLEQLLEVLNPERGVAYILLCQQNKPEEVMRQIRGWGQGWCVCVVGRSGMQAGWEKLLVIRICRC